MIRHPWRFVAELIFAALLGVTMGYITSANMKEGDNFEGLMTTYLTMSVSVPIFFLGPCNFLMS